jgi:hypothetical protein
MKRACFSFSSSLGVVPEEISAWKPDRAAGDGDEQEREQRTRPDRAGAVDELGHRRHLQVRRDDQDAERQATMVPIFRKVDR